MPTPTFARRPRAHLAAALVAAALIVPFAPARADAFIGTRTTGSPNWECIAALGFTFLKIPYEFDTVMARYLWDHCL